MKEAGAFRLWEKGQVAAIGLPPFGEDGTRPPQCRPSRRRFFLFAKAPPLLMDGAADAMRRSEASRDEWKIS